MFGTKTTLTPTTTPTGEERWLVTVEYAEGRTDTIEAYDFDAALAFSHMHGAAEDYDRRYGYMDERF